MGKKPTKGQNDFVSWCINNNKMYLVDEWDDEINTVSPASKSYGSHYKAAWKCSKCCHTWVAAIKSRTILNAGCPKCGFEKVRIAQSQPKEHGDVETFCKEYQIEWLLTEWDFEENELLPQNVSRASSKHRVVWRCRKCGHRWELSPNQRIRLSSDNSIRVSECPMCSKEKQTSFPEQSLYYYVKKSFPDAINREMNSVGMELDIYIPTLNTAIEYDGYAWHQNTSKDARKNSLCKRNGIRLT